MRTADVPSGPTRNVDGRDCFVLSTIVLTDAPGIVVGLAAEARLARPWNLAIATGGGTARGAAAAADRLAPSVTALISFGLAGGLDPRLRPGDLVVPTRVVDGPEAWDTDPRLNHLLGGPTPHVLLGGGTVLASVHAKARAFQAGSHAVDLESAAVARAAARNGLPFAVLRAVCDPAHRALPHAALAALDAQGRIGFLRVALAALAHPMELPALLALARDAARARRQLVNRVRATPGLNPAA